MCWIENNMVNKYESFTYYQVILPTRSTSLGFFFLICVVTYFTELLDGSNIRQCIWKYYIHNLKHYRDLDFLPVVIINPWCISFCSKNANGSQSNHALCALNCTLINHVLQLCFVFDSSPSNLISLPQECFLNLVSPYFSTAN